MKKIASIVFFILIFIILLLIIISKIDNSPIMILKVLSGSMDPTIKLNEMVIVKKEKKYMVSDIVTYQVDDYYVTHRIVNVNGNEIITKGDSNNVNDEAISEDLIRGKVILIIPKFYYSLIKIVGILALMILLIIVIV